jgi:DNA-cytosine methyltransferase
MDLGLARAGMRHAFLCEQDPYRRRVLERHWPGVPVYEDVRDVASDGADGYSQGDRRYRHLDRAGHNERADRGTAQRDSGSHALDLLCGGFPCQDLSVAGKRKGLAGERSGLFFEFARIADAFLGPGGWLLTENVPGLLSSHGGRDFAVLLASLGELGFHDLAWRVLDSRYFGVPQRRRRVFILARRARGRRACEVLLEPESGGGDFAPRREAGQGASERVEDGAARTLKADGGTSIKGEDHDTYIPVEARPLTKGSAAGEGVSYPGRRREDDYNLVAHTPLGPDPDCRERSFAQSAKFRGDSSGSGDSGGNVVSPPPDPHGVREVAGTTGRVDDRPWGWADEMMGKPERDVMGTLRIASSIGMPPPHMVFGNGTASDRCAVDPKPDGPRYAGCGDAVTANVAEWIGRRLLAA